MRALYTSASGMTAQQFNLDVIANNLANVNTAGFKRSAAHFEDLLYQNLRAPGALNAAGGQIPAGAQVGLGVASGTTRPLLSQGNIQQTGGDFDVAIQGNGFLKVLVPDGTTAYTRDGALTIDGQGRVVTQEGYPVQPEIIVPIDKESINIATDGTVSIRRAGQANFEQAGQIQLTMFTNPAGLERIGSNLYRASTSSGDPQDLTPGSGGVGTLLHHAVEGANVEVVEEMIRMITIQRAYETNSKAIVAADEMLQGANNLKR